MVALETRKISHAALVQSLRMKRGEAAAARQTPASTVQLQWRATPLSRMTYYTQSTPNYAISSRSTRSTTPLNASGGRAPSARISATSAAASSVSCATIFAIAVSAARARARDVRDLG